MKTKMKYCHAVRHVSKTSSKTMKKLFPIISYLQTHHYFRLDFQKWTNIQETSTAPNTTTRRISCKAWNSRVEYPSRKSKHDIKESEDNMFNLIFKGNVQGQKQSGRCAFAEPELLSYTKPKRVAQNKRNGHKNPNNNHDCHMYVSPRKSSFQLLRIQL